MESITSDQTSSTSAANSTPLTTVNPESPTSSVQPSGNSKGSSKPLFIALLMIVIVVLVVSGALVFLKSSGTKPSQTVQPTSAPTVAQNQPSGTDENPFEDSDNPFSTPSSTYENPFEATGSGDYKNPFGQ